MSILGLSILFNAFLCGFIFSINIHPNRMPFMGREHSPPPMEDMILDMTKSQSRKLSADGQRKIVEITDKYQEKFHKSKIVNAHDIIDKIHIAMTAESFDKTKVEKLHQYLSDKERQSKNNISNMMIEIADTLSNTDRILFFKELVPPPHMGNGSGENDTPPPPPMDY
jgi:hypothetical protein